MYATEPGHPARLRHLFGTSRFTREPPKREFGGRLCRASQRKSEHVWTGRWGRTAVRSGTRSRLPGRTGPQVELVSQGREAHEGSTSVIVEGGEAGGKRANRNITPGENPLAWHDSLRLSAVPRPLGLTERGYRRTIEMSPVAPTHARLLRGMRKCALRPKALGASCCAHVCPWVQTLRCVVGTRVPAPTGLAGSSALKRRRGITRSSASQGVIMAKALYGHVGAAPDRRLLDEVTRLRSRVQALEFEITRLRADNDRLAAAAADAEDILRLTEPALT
jgi:uncharacterized small protein (DUF1192 family)